MSEEGQPDLLGRAPELDLLALRLAEARQGRGRLITVVGEAGIGKSALTSAFAERAQAAGWAVTQGRAWELSEAPAWFPVWPCLRSLGLPAPPPPQEDGGFLLWHEVLAGLAASASTRPVLWVLEDVHAADASTLDLLSFLARPLTALPAMVLVTLRPDHASTDDGAIRRLARLRRDALEVQLHPLDPADVSRLAARVAGRPLRPNEGPALSERTGGNPLFVIECARAARGGPITGAPSTVQQVVRERVEALGARCRQLLHTAAVLGREVPAGVLAHMLGTLPAAVIDGLGPALRAGILVETDPGRFRFTHALVGEALLAGLSHADRAQAHHQAAVALGTLGDAPASLVDRAQHHLAALLHGAPAAGLDQVERASRWLQAQGAFDRALALESRLLRAQESGLMPPPEPADLLRVAILALQAGAYGQSRALSLRAADLARERLDPIGLAEAALTLGAELAPGVIDTALVRLLDEALGALPPEHPALRIRVKARLAGARQPAPDPSEPVALAREAIDEARTHGDKAVLSDALFHAGAALADYAPDVEIRAISEQLLEVALHLRQPARALRACARLTLSCGQLGDLDASDRFLDQALAIARQVGNPALQWRPLLLASMRALARGQVVDSERYITEAQGLAELTDDPGLRYSLMAHGFCRAMTLEQGDLVREALPHVEAAVSAVPGGVVDAAGVIGMALARLGDAAAAANCAGRVPLSYLRDAVRGLALGGRGELFAAAGTREQREAARQALAESGLHHVYSGHIPMTYEGPVQRQLGLLDASLRRWDEAEANLLAARATSERLGYHAWVTRLGLELGLMHRARGDHERAEAELRQAQALSEALGIDGLAGRIRTERRSRAEPPPAPPATSLALQCHKNGDTWAISLGDRLVRARDSRGLALIARLVQRPGEEIHVLTLASDTDEVLAETTSGEALDAQALQEYRRRLDRIAAELDRANLRCDRHATDTLEREREFLERELARATGLHGRRRAVGSVAERARINVQRRVKDAILRIAELDPAVAAHLHQAIRTGTWCTYRP